MQEIIFLDPPHLYMNYIPHRVHEIGFGFSALDFGTCFLLDFDLITLISKIENEIK